MRDKVRNTIKKYHMLQKGDKVVAGVSGGPDSMALLHILLSLKEEYGLFITVVHINHGLREEESEGDAHFVEQYCLQNRIPCKIENMQIREMALERGMGLEEAGRQARYQAFEDAAKSCGGAKIAVAHNKNDQAETVLMRLCRGAGLKGLSGIAPVRGEIIRPLIDCTREEIEGYCREQSIDYCVDKTNALDIYTRNKIRIQLLPFLEREINPNMVETLARTAEILSAENRFLDQEADKAFLQCAKKEKEAVVLDAALLSQIPEAVGRRVVFLAVAAVTGLSLIHIFCGESCPGRGACGPKKSDSSYHLYSARCASF